MRRLFQVVLVGLAAAAVGCGRDAPSQPQGATDIPPPAQARAPFVVFARSALVIDRLEVPVRLPVTAGSTASAGTLSSDAPEVVSVEPDGQFVAHQAGTATIRATGNDSVLSVLVQTAGELVLVPRKLALRPGEARQLRLVEKDGSAEAPADAIEWTTSDPAVATLFRGDVMASGRAGRARITARYGGRQAEALVVVGNGAPSTSRGNP